MENRLPQMLVHQMIFPWFSFGFPMVSLGFPMVSYGFPMVFCGFPMVSLGFPMVSYGFPMVFCGFPMVSNKKTQEIPSTGRSPRAGCLLRSGDGEFRWIRSEVRSPGENIALNLGLVGIQKQDFTVKKTWKFYHTLTYYDI